MLTLILPDTTYLERHDCISLLDRPICEPDAVADSIRWPVVGPDRDVRGFQSVLLELGGRLGLNGMTAEDGSPLYKDYADYIINHQRKPGIGPLAGFRARMVHHPGAASLTRTSWMPISIMAAFGWKKSLKLRVFTNTPIWIIRNGRLKWAFRCPSACNFQLWLEPLAKFQLAANGHGTHIPPDHIKEQIKKF